MWYSMISYVKYINKQVVNNLILGFIAINYCKSIAYLYNCHKTIREFSESEQESETFSKIAVNNYNFIIDSNS